MNSEHEHLVIEERHKSARVELVLFACSRLALFLFVTAGMGWVLRSILESLLLSLQHLFNA